MSFSILPSRDVSILNNDSYYSESEPHQQYPTPLDISPLVQAAVSGRRIEIPDINLILSFPGFPRNGEDANVILDFVRDTQMEFQAQRFRARFHLLRLQRLLEIEASLRAQRAPQSDAGSLEQGCGPSWRRRASSLVRRYLFRQEEFPATFKREVTFWEREYRLAEDQLLRARSAIAPTYAQLGRRGIQLDLSRALVLPAMWVENERMEELVGRSASGEGEGEEASR
ncbi:hypothetical protein BV25DRAFT_1921600 [Artomyces pyxidatus]|uniref:Uncharacterized protein n=1 Tax=Artomyces pyxidatus TaxID=48021 RepID=A0ACB8SGW9_9AGAM|nr:hypothetical protein BV25DRAFT_1921600 [Artomyces pyxidatus]